MWAKSKGLLGEQISIGGRSARGFALAAPSDPDVWSKFSTEQQTWVMNTLVALDANIKKAGGGTCATFGPSVTAAGQCFQYWFNNNYKAPIAGMTLPLRTDGVFDQDTFYALARVASDHPKDFPAPFPGAPTTTMGAPKKLSTGAIVGIAAAGATALGGIIYVATRKKSRRSRRK